MTAVRLALITAVLSAALSAQTAPTLGGCPAFPANNVFNTRIDALPVHPHSADYITSISATGHLRWDTSIPYNTVPGTQPLVPLNINYADESDPGPYPIPPSAQIEDGGDRHVLVVDTGHCVLYETYNSYLNSDGSWTVDSAAKWNLLSNALRPATWTSADAAGLPITPLLLRYDEVAAGQVNHTIRFTAPTTQKLFLWPARHYASNSTSALLPPMGARFRLKASFDISGFSAANQTILRAMKQYGIILADNGSAWFFQLATDSRWNTSDLDNLRWGVVGSNFEAVDESSLMIDPDSGAAVQSNSPAALSSISVSPTSVTGGNNVNVTVNLTAASSGALVTLTGSSAAFPTTTVTVSTGLLTQTFSVATAAVTVATNVTITASYNGATATAPLAVNPPATSAPSPLQFVPIAPCRILDTRGPNGSLGGPALAAGVARTIPILSSACGIPASAMAYSLNATVVPAQGALGYLTLWPAGQTQPAVSTLNSPDGSIIANSLIVSAGSSGSINAFVTQTTHLVLDINGYFTTPGSGTLAFYPLPPCRVLDTRNPTGTFGGPAITGGTSRGFPFQLSSCGIPAAAKVYSINVTVVPSGFLGYVTAYPQGQPQPNTSTLNSLDGTVLANHAIVAAGAPNGGVSFYANNTTNLVVDVDGYFAPPGTGGLNFYIVPPCRIVDTRFGTGSLGGPSINSGTMRSFPLPTSACGLPSTAGAYSLNVTAVPAGFLGYITAFPTGATQPNASTLNDSKGIVVANAAIIPAGVSGAVSIYVMNQTNIILDTNGYFAQ